MISIVLVDAEGKILQNVVPEFRATNTNNGNSYGACPATDVNGFTQCTLKSTVAENKQLWIVSPEAFSGGSVQFIPNEATDLRFRVNPAASMLVGETMAVDPVVEILDILGNQIVSSIGYIELEAFTDSSCTVPATGVLYVDQNPLSPGGIATEVTFTGIGYSKQDDIYLKASTPDLNSACSSLVAVRQFVDHDVSGIVGTNTVANGSNPSQITITLIDTLGNPMFGTVPTFIATDTGHTNIYGDCTPADTQGISHCLLKSTKAEEKTISLKTPAVMTGNTVTFEPGPVATTTSSITGTTDVVADNFEISYITVTLLDAYNNPIKDFTPTFAATGSENTLIGCTPTSNTGASTCSLKSTKAEDKVLSIVNPFILTGDTVTFINGPLAKLDYSTAPSSQGYADIPLEVAPTLRALDAFDNPVSAPNVSVTLAPYTNAACTIASYGTLSADNITVTTVNGIATFSNVKHSKAETLYIRAISGGWAECYGPINIGARPALTFSSDAFVEAATNIGAMSGSLTIDLVGTTFSGSNSSDLIAAGKVTASNVPDGLTAVAIKVSDTQLTISLNGNATEHGNGANIDNLAFEFLDTAFTDLTADLVLDHNRDDLKIEFDNAYTLAYAGSKFSEVIANTGNTEDTIVLSLAGTTFTGAQYEDFVAAGKLNILNLPDGMTFVAIKDSNTRMTVSITGSANAHANTNDVTNLTLQFQDNAFASGSAAGVLGANKDDLEIDFEGPAVLTYSEAAFTEVLASDGSIAGSITITLTGDTFSSPFVSSNVTATNVPEGLTFNIANLNSTTMIVSLSGHALAHTDADDVTNMQISFADATFVNNTVAANVENAQKDDLLVDFMGPAILDYGPGLFNESLANDGSVNESLTITLDGDTFAASIAGKISASNVPTGLSAAFTRLSDTQIKVDLTGNASNHLSADSINNLGIAFIASAFVNITDIANITNSVKSDLGVQFRDYPSIAYDSTVFDERFENDGAITNTLIITLDGDVFAPDLAGRINVTNIPAGLTVSLIRDSDTQISMSLTGNATNHSDEDDVSNLGVTFLASAIVNVSDITQVANYNKNDLSVDFDNPVGLAVSDEGGSTTSGVTSEDGGSATFGFALAAEPIADVTISFTSSDTSEGTLSVSSLTFTPANWSSAQTVIVTGVDDSISDPDQAYSIDFSAITSADSRYNGLTPPSISMTNTDNEVPGITVSAISGDVDETGTTATFTIKLDCLPGEDVTIGISSSDLTEGTVAPASLTFTSANGTTAQTITVTGVNDDLSDGDQLFNIITAAASSSDLGYNGMNPDDVAVNNIDDDVTVAISAISGNTSESGDSATFTVSLDTEPIADVTVSFFSSDTTEGTLGTSQLTFTPANWNAPQTVTVYGVDDLVSDTDQTYFIIFDAISSSDFRYSGIIPESIEVTNIDNEVPEIIVSQISGDVSEGGDTATFTVVLGCLPTSDVTIGLTSSDLGEGTISHESLTFTNTNGMTAQTVTVTGVDDELVDGTITFNIVTAEASSDDTGYNGINPDDVAVNNLDDEITIGLSISAISGPTSETGDSGTFSVVLESAPTEDVSITFISSDLSEGLLGLSELTFTPDNWNAPQVVVVTGVDDDISDGDQTYYVVFYASESQDERYHGIIPPSISVVNVDDETPGITVSEISGDITESGDTATFTVVLNCLPNDEVTINLSSSDLGEGTVLPATLTFTSTNGTSPQTVTVTGIDDDIIDGTQIFDIITAAATSNDEGYNGINPADVSVNNLDNDGTIGIYVGPISGPTSEASATAIFSVVLLSEPAADVIIDLSSSDTGEGVMLPSSLTFTPENWNAGQVVTVYGLNDNIQDGDQQYKIITAPAISLDPRYNNFNAEDVDVINLDDDSWGIQVSEISGETSEGGDTATFTIVLNSGPTADVLITFSSSDETEGTVEPSSLTFTSDNWFSPQEVTVTGVDDTLQDGRQVYNVVFEPTSSTDDRYNNILLASVAVTNRDDDYSHGFLLTEVTGNTAETETASSFTIQLTSEPSDDVVISVTSNDETEGIVSVSSVTFNSDDWSSPQTIVITGVDDDLEDGNQYYTIILGVAASNDSNYNGLKPNNVSLYNYDDDTPGVTVYPKKGLATTEAGGEASFTVVLNTPPTVDIVINLSSSDTSEGTIDASSLTFTPDNWAAEQTVVITGVDDNKRDGNKPYKIRLEQISSSDQKYSGINPSDVYVTNYDDETRGIKIGPRRLKVSENGTTADFSARLTSRPTADVTFSLTSTDLTEGTISVSSLTFTPDNWNAPQIVTVTGVDDDIRDGTKKFKIKSGKATSADSRYNNLRAKYVKVYNYDNDKHGFHITPRPHHDRPLITTEDGGTAEFRIKLHYAPTQDVTIPISSSDTSEGTVDKSSITFTPSNWNQQQTVTITGVDDQVNDGNKNYKILFGRATSSDNSYHHHYIRYINVRNIDNDDADFVISQRPHWHYWRYWNRWSHMTPVFVVRESSGTCETFTVKLSKAPTHNVTFSVHSSNDNEITVSPEVVTFTPQNWNVPQTITVQGVDDGVRDGDQHIKIYFGKATSGDNRYHNKCPKSFRAKNEDDDD
ncbi:MAG: hypothetical protein ISR65_15435 [Bacteriovoracaceae bacterium]|nr:hypothetical protein [Bacteriovoracaceae bacterium]